MLTSPFKTRQTGLKVTRVNNGTETTIFSDFRFLEPISKSGSSSSSLYGGVANQLVDQPYLTYFETDDDVQEGDKIYFNESNFFKRIPFNAAGSDIKMIRVRKPEPMGMIGTQGKQIHCAALYFPQTLMLKSANTAQNLKAETISTYSGSSNVKALVVTDSSPLNQLNPQINSITTFVYDIYIDFLSVTTIPKEGDYLIQTSPVAQTYKILNIEARLVPPPENTIEYFRVTAVKNNSVQFS